MGEIILISVAAIIFSLAFIVLIFLIMRINNRINETNIFLSNNYEKFAPELKSVVDLAIRYWELNNSIAGLKEMIPDPKYKKMNSSLRKISEYLSQNDVEVIDYTGRAYTDGIVVDVISSEIDPAVKKPLIKETYSPAVIYRGNLIKKAQVIIAKGKEEK